MTAHEFLKNLSHLPYDVSSARSRPSNSQLCRWLNNGSIVINGVTPKANDEINFPIESLKFFPKGNTVTML